MPLLVSVLSPLAESRAAVQEAYVDTGWVQEVKCGRTQAEPVGMALG